MSAPSSPCHVGDVNNIANSNVVKIDDAIQAVGMGKFQRRVLFAAGLCFTADATEVMLLSFLSLTLQAEWGLTANQTATMTACVFAGSLFGTLALGYFGDHYGRRPAFLIASGIISIFGVLTAFATGYASLLAVRFMVGFGVGGVTVPFDIYAEFLPPSHRGTHLLVIEYFWTAGSIMAPLIAYLTLNTSWRLFVVLCAVPCIISGVLGAYLVPESPRWLISVGRDQEAMEVIRSAITTNGQDPEELFDEKVQLKDEHVESSNFCDLLSRKWRKITLFLWLTWMGYAIGYYGSILAVTRVFDPDAAEDAEFHEGSPNFDYKAIFISASAEIFGLFIVIQTVDSIGRIPSQVASYIMAGIFMFTLAMSVGTANNTILTILAFLCRAFEMMGACVTWVTTAEILPTEIRTTGHAASNAMGRTGAFISPYLVGTNNPIKIVGCIMLVVHLMTALSAFHLPESKGHEMGHMLNDDEDINGKDSCEVAFRYKEAEPQPQTDSSPGVV
ncbi:hypothetical protein ACHAXS_009790 [Conticribra weissflogii]